MKRSNTNIIKLLGLIALSAISPTSLAQDKALSWVKTDTVTMTNLSASAELIGTLHSRDHVDITAGVSGRLDWLAAPGSYVEQGETLVKIDLLPLQLRLAEQKAQLKRAKINMAYLKNEWQRLLKLGESQLASQFQLDQSRSQFQLAQTDIEIAGLKLQQIQDELNRAHVKAPFSGVVTQRFARASKDANRGDVLLKLLDTQHLEARVFVPIKYLPFVRRGEILQVSIEVNNKVQEVDAKIIATIPNADARSQTFEVRVSIPEQLNATWAAGQLVKVTVPIQSRQAQLSVHRDALILKKEGTYVVKLDSENKAHPLLVTLGSGNLERVAVFGDLAQGDKVAVRGAGKLTENQQVRVQ